MRAKRCGITALPACVRLCVYLLVFSARRSIATTRVAVIGAGEHGLIAAAHLKARGCDVAIYEIEHARSSF